MNLYDEACQFAKHAFCDFEGAEAVTKEEVEAADGRRRSNPISQKGSYVYAAYDASGCLLYVGETEESIKDRFSGHGSGAHNRKCWYGFMESVKFKKLNSGGKDYRKLLEKALILAGRPKYQK